MPALKLAPCPVLLDRAKGLTDEQLADLIAYTVCAKYGLSIDELKTHRRMRRLVKPRQIVMHLLRKYTDMTVNEIADYFGGFDHSTVCDSDKKCRELMEADADYRKEVQVFYNIF